MAQHTFATAAAAVEKLASIMVRGGKRSNAFAIVRIGKSKINGEELSRVPTAEAKIIARKTGVDLTVPADLARVILSSKGKLFTDGTRVWTAAAEAARKAKAAEYRDTATAVRASYAEAAAEAVEAEINL